MSEPTPNELARDIEQLERVIIGKFSDLETSRLKRIEDVLESIRENMVAPSTFKADQLRQDQQINTNVKDIEDIESENRSMRRILIGSLLFPIIVLIITGILIAGLPSG